MEFAKEWPIEVRETAHQADSLSRSAGVWLIMLRSTKRWILLVAKSTAAL
jgi:hypothetical protein